MKGFYGVGALMVAMDQGTKFWVAKYLALNESRQILGDWIRLTHTRNSGIAFSLFSGGESAWRNPTLILLALGVMGWIFWNARRIQGEVTGVQWAYGLIVGGAAGNVVDRLRHGMVTDFLDVGISQWRWPVFNVADSAVFIGAGLLMWYMVVKPSK